MLLHRRLLKGHGLYSSCYGVPIFLLLVSSDHKVHIYLLQSTAVYVTSLELGPLHPLSRKIPFHFFHSQQATYVIRILVDPRDYRYNFYNFYQGQYLPMAEKGLQLISKPNYLSGSLFTPQLYPTILAEVTIYPARFLLCFGFYQCHYSHQAIELLPCYCQHKREQLCKFTDFFSQ